MQLPGGSAIRRPIAQHWRSEIADRKTRMSALPSKADMCGTTRDVRFGPKADISWASSFEPLRREQEVVEGLGSRCHTRNLRAKNIGVGGQHFDIHCFVDALDDSRSHH
jgi:hypothetical protein